MPLAIALIVFAALWRIVSAHVPELANFAPIMALTFCGAVYFRDKRMWLVSLIALLASDVYLDRYYATVFQEEGTWPSMATRMICFAMALPLGALVARHRNWINLFSGALGGAVLFYLVTNTDAWLRDPAYIKSAAGWWQALTVGRPEYPPTLFFFRNTLVSDLVFTGVFALVMESSARRAGAASLLGKRVET
jgi:hypothetical protein